MPSMESHWATKERLYGILVLFLFLGMLFPALALVSKLAANNFSNFYYVVQRIPGITELIQQFPLLDVGKKFPILSDWSWHAQWNQRSFPQYLLINGLILAIVIFKRTLVLQHIQRLVEWLHVKEYQIPRRYIAVTSFILVATFLLKINFGFWFPGMAGWTYANWESRIQSDPPEGIDKQLGKSFEGQNFLHQAYLANNALYLSRSGYVKGKAIFLHFQGGEVLPGNFELLEMVYPEYVFGRNMGQDHLHGRFFRIVQESLKRRIKGKRFLLPITIAYPNHSSYIPIDYRGYPDSGRLQKISFWELLVSIDKEKNISLVDAVLVLEISGGSDF